MMVERWVSPHPPLIRPFLAFSFPGLLFLRKGGHEILCSEVSVTIPSGIQAYYYTEPIAQMDNMSGHTSSTSRHIWNTCGSRLIRFLGVCSTNSPNTRWGQSDTPDTHKHMLAQVLINERSCSMASAPGAPLVLLRPTSISPRHPPCPLCLHITQVPGHQARSMWIHVCTPRSTP